MKSLIFTLLAPITVPLYVLFLALANLFGGAYYIVVEASLAKILRRPVSLSRKQLWIYSIPVICAAPIALAAHLLIAAARAFIAFLRFVGRWQADVQGKWTAVIPGLAWTLIAFWVLYYIADTTAGLMQGMFWLTTLPLMNSIEAAEPFWATRAVSGVLITVATICFIISLMKKGKEGMEVANVSE